MQSSGKQITFTPCLSASFIREIIASALYIQSATRISGVAAATFTNPSFVLNRSIRFILRFYKFYFITFKNQGQAAEYVSLWILRQHSFLYFPQEEYLLLKSAYIVARFL